MEISHFSIREQNKFQDRSFRVCKQDKIAPSVAMASPDDDEVGKTGKTCFSNQNDIET